MLYVNTPGGSVYESDELYLKIKEYQQETGRPVYTYMAAMAASGGYYISAPTDKIIANRNTWTGSIGVTIGTIYDVTGLMEKYGIKAVTIDSGANKSMGSITQPMTPEQQEIFQGLVNEAYEQFVSIVAEGRSLSVDQVKTLADGRIYTAKQAMEVGLVDEIATFGEAKEKMIEDYGLGQCNFYDFQPQEMGLLETLMSTASQLNAGSGGDIQSLMQLMNKKGDFPIAYMSDWTK
ncbi:MAG: signal peptide peptidase SppA, partial [Anaerovoracaceae bacterium]